MDDVTAKRLAADEERFRLRNDVVVADLVDDELPDGAFVVVCECARPQCTVDVEIALDEYERVRERPGHYVLEPGHQLPLLEDVVERSDHYVVVRKRD